MTANVAARGYENTRVVPPKESTHLIIGARLTDSSYNTSTVATDKAVVTLAVGATASRSFSFSLNIQTPTGFYTVIVTVMSWGP
jgi:hypothetical protein